MRSCFHKAALLAALSMAALAANADVLPNLSNLDFSQYTGTAPKAGFTDVNPVGWTGGNGLIFIDSPTTPGQDAAGPVYLTTYGDPLPNLPGNYVEADGNPDFASGFNYSVSGLTPGKTYTLTFYQAASQQTTFANGLNTTEQWIVSLGTAGMVACVSCGAPDTYYGGQDSTYSNADPLASVVLSPLMTTPSGSTTPWQQVTVQLTATASTNLLSFLAWGDNGNNVNLPPIVFLTGVNTPNLLPVPELAPSSLLLVGVAFLGVAVSKRRKSRNSRSGAAG